MSPERFVGGLTPGLGAAILLLGLGTLTLVFSMVVASRLAGGIDFGPPLAVAPRAAARDLSRRREGWPR